MQGRRRGDPFSFGANMRVVSLAAGAGGMICGSCMRDNRLAATLRSIGRDIVLLPLYTPLKTDEEDASLHEVRFGGINVYLEQYGIRRLPEWIARCLDAPALLRRVMRFSSSVRPSSLGGLTVSILEGLHGAQKREIDRLIETLRPIGPDLVSLPNLMLLGAAEPLRNALDVPIVCTLSGEDIFLDQLADPHRRRAFELIRRHADHVDAFISVTNYFADHAARHFSLPRERIHVVPMGIRVEDFDHRAASHASMSISSDGTLQPEFTVGYLARVCPEKGLANLCEAMIELRRAGRQIRILAAGYLARSDRAYLKAIESRLKKDGVENSFHYLGEVTREQKIELFHSVDAFSVPTDYVEAKGFFVLEAMAAGVPVIQPNHGSFPELIEAAGGGLLYDPSDSNGLANALSRLMDDAQLRTQLGANGRNHVSVNFTDVQMAHRSWELFEKFVADDSKNRIAKTKMPVWHKREDLRRSAK